jgi:dCTP deaminase
MSLITHTELQLLIADGLLTVDTHDQIPYNRIEDAQINGASVDVRLGRTFLRETPPGAVTFRPSYYVCLKGKEQLVMSKEIIPWGYPFYLAPGEFILAQTVEIFNLPNNIAAEFRLKSSVARAGLDQALAVWCDPGWHNSVLTVELRNNTRYHTLVLEAGMKIGQVIFFRGTPIPEAASYAVRGQYNNLSEVTGNKGVK